MELPKFKYHPDPVKTGSIKKSDETCECCGKKMGYIYSGSMYGRNTPENLCPWCISDGTAYEKYELEFASIMPAVIDPNNPSEINCSEKAFNELLHKTPAFSSYQEIEWPNHCEDFCEFHGLAKVSDVKEISEGEKTRLFETSYLDEEELAHLVSGEDSEELHYFLKFKCVKCGELKFQFDPD